MRTMLETTQRVKCTSERSNRTLYDPPLSDQRQKALWGILRQIHKLLGVHMYSPAPAGQVSE